MHKESPMFRKTLFATLCATAVLSLPLSAGAAPTENYKSDLGTVTVTPVAEGCLLYTSPSPRD